MNFTMEKASEIRKLVLDTVGYKSDASFTLAQTDGVYVEKSADGVKVGGGSIPMLARAFFLSFMKEKNGEDAYKIEEKPHFSRCGAMLDMSRNGVMKVEAVKRYINYIASIGMNVFMLYMEDTYEVEGYPYMGYMRGRYSAQELREIDDYAYSLGVEVIACMQTLGHMSQYLHWKEDQRQVKGAASDVLLVGDEDTYTYLDACFKTIKGALRSSYINVGMDEAPDMLRGKYYDINGPAKYYDVFMKHLHRVCDLCAKHGLKPMMWSDMVTKEYSPNGRYHNVGVKFDDKVKEDLPENIGMVYWNYGKDTYNELLSEHNRLEREVIYAGGSQTWFGYLPWYAVMVDNAHLGVKACLRNGIDFVTTTIWNDDGCETNQFMAINTLPYYSEYCYKGMDCTEQDIFDAAEFLSGISEEDARLMFDVNLRIDDDAPIFDDKTVFVRDLIYSDVLYDQGSSAENCAIVLPKMKENVKRLAQSPEKCGGLYEYAYYVHSIITTKAELRVNLRKAYQEGDREYIEKVCKTVLPELIFCYEKLYGIFKTMWLRDYKPFGLEVITVRFGGIKQRLADIRDRFENYLNGGEEIYELKEDVLPTFGFGTALEFFTPSAIK